jgi:hypothetical protein
MPYIGQQPTSVAFLTDQFNGNGSTTAFTLSAAPANTSSVLVAVSGVLQDPSTYSVSGTTLTFSAAPPSGTGNISVRFLGIPASGVTTTAYRTVTEFTATASQTTFSVPSYTVGFIDVYRNGVMLGSADYTATNGTTVVLATGATSGDLVEVISFSVSSVLNAIPASPSSVGTSYLVDGSVTAAKLASGAALSNLGTSRLADANMPAGSVLQVLQNSTVGGSSTSSTSYVDMTNGTVTITPSSASSNILVIASGNSFATLVGGVNVIGYVQLVRTSTSIQERLFSAESGSGGLQGNFPTSFCVLDSPATTSAVTYKLQQRVSTGSSSAITSGYRIIVQEIAG